MENISENKKQVMVAIALVRNSDGKFLLQKRLDPLIPEANEKWEFPGGRIEYGENPEETVKREFVEEVGCDIKIKKLIPLVQSSVWARSDSKEQQAIIICYEAEIISGAPSAQDQKVAEVAWFSREELKGLDTLRGINKFIDLVND